MSFTSEDGMLSDGVFSYHLLDEVTPEEMDAMTSGEGEATAAEGGDACAMGDIGPRLGLQRLPGRRRIGSRHRAGALRERQHGANEHLPG